MSPVHIESYALREFPTLDITCSHCSSVIKLKLPQNDLPHNAACMGCNSPFWDGEGNPFRIMVLGLLRTISKCHDTTAESRFKIGFSLLAPGVSSRDA